MKRIKILIIIISIFIFSGCKGEYNIIINKDLTISENVNISIENKDNAYEKTINLFENNDIEESRYNVTQNDDYVNIKYKEDFSNFEDYFLNSKFYNRIISNEDFNKNNKGLKYKSFANLKLDDKENSKLNNSFYISNLKINITSPYTIRENNADEVKNNTLTWILKENDTQKKFYFNLEYMKQNNFYIVIILLCILIVIIPTIYLITKYFKEKGI